MWRPGARRFQGQNWQMEEMLKLMLVIFIFAGAVLIIIGVSGGLTGVLQEFCDKNPQWCGNETRTEEYYKVTLKSSQALACAIRASINNEDKCFEDYKKEADEPSEDDIFGGGSPGPPSGGGGGFAISKALNSVTGLQTGNGEFDEPSITCNFREKDDDIPEIKQQDSWWKRQWWRIKNFFVDPEVERYGCVIHNYHMPQDVSVPERWISGYGDPQFLVYFQSFPPGEDSYWRGYSTWLDNVGAVVLFAFPAGKLLQGGGWLIKKGALTVAEKTGVTKMTQKGKNILTNFFQKARMIEADTTVMMMSKSMTRKARQEAMEGYYSQYILNKHGRPYHMTATKPLGEVTETEGTSLLKRLGFKIGSGGADSKGMTWADFKAIGRLTGKTTMVAILAALIDSMNEKFEKHGRNIVLKSPYEAAEEVGDVDNVWRESSRIIPEEWIYVGHPIILDKELGFLQDPFSRMGIRPSFTNFYLASPCHADITVDYGNGDNVVFCESYGYDRDSGAVDCKYVEREEACRQAINLIGIGVATKYCDKPEKYFDYIPVCGIDNDSSFDPEDFTISGNRNTWCRISAVKITVNKLKTEGNNFCYGKPSSLTVPIFVGAIIGDILLKEIGVGWVPQVSFGMIASAAYVTSYVTEKWP